MKQKNIKIIISAIIALIILVGIVVVNIWGFNKELQYEKGQSIEIYLEQKADIAKIKEIVNNELGTKNLAVVCKKLDIPCYDEEVMLTEDDIILLDNEIQDSEDYITDEDDILEEKVENIISNIERY